MPETCRVNLNPVTSSGPESRDQAKHKIGIRMATFSPARATNHAALGSDFHCGEC
jgi:hypothetical protein